MPNTLRMASISSDFPLAVRHMRDHGPTSLHNHDFTELVVILSGCGEHYSSGASYRVIAGDAFVVTQAHGYRDTECLELVNILFDRERLCLQMDDALKLPGYHAFFALEPRYRKKHGFKSILHLDMPELAAVAALITQLETELDARASGYEFMAKSLLMQLIGRLSRAYEGMRAVESRPLLRLGAALSHMEKHYAEDITLEDLARMSGLSVSTLQRSFRAITGHPPIEYLIRLRMLRACELLRGGDLNVTETANRVGFSDSNYFSRQFRRLMECTPREYARRARAAV
jgi:AraC-like DNA-binding protein